MIARRRYPARPRITRGIARAIALLSVAALALVAATACGGSSDGDEISLAS